jgi:4-aminobutyrate aminotransferase-like enzyme
MMIRQFREKVVGKTREARSTYNASSPVFSAGDGSWLIDEAGNKYLDCTAGSGAISVGHSNPEVIEAVFSQAKKLMHTGCKLQSIERSTLVSRLAQLVWYRNPKILPAVTGAEAVEAALKVARAHTNRKQLLAFNYSYHGKTTGALAVTWREALKAHISHDKNNTVFCPAPYLGVDWACGTAQAIDCLNRTLLELQAGKNLPAAIIVEPIESTEGVLVIDPAFLTHVRQVCDKYNILLIFDEVYTGFGRTGSMFYAERIGVHPDLLIIGKGMANGLPSSAVIGEAEIVDSLPEGMQTSTFSGGVLASAVANTVIGIIQSQDLSGRAATIGAHLMESLDLLSQNGLFSKSRGSGLMIGFDCVADDGHCDPALAARVAKKALDRGIVFFYGGYAGASIRLTPPLTISHDEVSFLEKTLKEIQSEILRSPAV